MDLIRLNVPLAFLRNRAHLTWRSLRYGLQNELLSPDAIAEFAVEQIALADCPSVAVLDIADAQHRSDVAELLDQLAENEPRRSEDNLRQEWLYLVLAWFYDHRSTLSDPLQCVEEVYADFGYPERIASFVRYMPMDAPDLGSREANEARLFDRWRRYLEEERHALFDDGQPVRSSSLVDQLFVKSDGMLTPLEHDLLSRFHARYKQAGFPAPENISVKFRENTGFGRFTHFEHDGEVKFPDCNLGLGKFDQFDMEGLHAGACFLVEIKEGKLAYLEIIVNGQHHWDGTERPWTLLDPETGALSE